MHYNDNFSRNPHDPWDKYAIPSKKQIEKPRVTTLADVFPAIDRWGIGIIHDLETLRGIAQQKPSYPPYNIKKFDGGVWRIDMAVAGFRKEDLAITVEERTLTVESKVSEAALDKELRDAHVLHQGIAQRNFRVQFALAEYVEVDNAQCVDGILTINLVTNIPEEKKPKVIDIQ